MNNRVPHHTAEEQHNANTAAAQQTPSPHSIFERDIQVENVSPERRHLPPPPFSLQKQVIIICKTPEGQVHREWRFDCKDITHRSARMDDLCRRRSSICDVMYIYVEHLHNFFANYERWLRTSELPDLTVTAADQRDVLVLWISMYELAREMDDWRLVAAINVKIMEVAKVSIWSFYKRSVVDYVKKARHDDELRHLLVDLHVAYFDGRIFNRYFWKLPKRLAFAIVRLKMLPHPPTPKSMAKVCAYHQHDHLYPLTECCAYRG
ncbi:hypothetical protein D6D08_05972 [Aureobasidium pullulans]|nr:hypothetical protein D6D08_05972 [Aureobasidium pullulans]